MSKPYKISPCIRYVTIVRAIYHLIKYRILVRYWTYKKIPHSRLVDSSIRSLFDTKNEWVFMANSEVIQIRGRPYDPSWCDYGTGEKTHAKHMREKANK